MCFAAGVSTKIVLFFLVLIFLQLEILSYRQADPQCLKDCGGRKARDDAAKKGELMCANLYDAKFYTKPSCEMTCWDLKPDEDQLNCWKLICIGRGFCEKPGTNSIKRDQCEEYITAGKVKYYEIGCLDYFTYFDNEKATRNNQTVNN